MNIFAKFHDNTLNSCDISLKATHCQPGVGAWDKARELLDSRSGEHEYLYVNILSVYPAVVEIFSSWPKQWTGRHRAVPLVLLKKHLLPLLCSPCVMEHNTKPPDVDGQLYMPIPQRLMRTFPSTKGEACLLVFQGRCSPSSWKTASYITHWFWFERSRASRHQNAAKLDWYTQRHVCQETTDEGRPQCNLQLRPEWLWTVLELSLLWMNGKGLDGLKPS